MSDVNANDASQPPLEGRVALITGGARGMGYACAGRLAQLGAQIVLFDVDRARVESAARELETSASSAVGIAVDVTDDAAVASAISEIAAHGRAPTILVNAAGILRSTRFADISFEEWRHVMSVNVDGTFLTMKRCLPLMAESGWGRVVNFSSTAGKSVSTLGGAHYTTSKAAVLGLTRAAAKEYAALGICVNAVCPGMIETEMVAEARSREELESYAARFPVGRLGRAEEVADLVAFLASPQAGYITGASFDINGGDLMV